MIKLTAKIALLIIGIVSAGVLWQKSTLIVLGLTQIDPIPETRALVEEKKYAEASQYLGFFMDYEYVRENPEAQALHAQIQSVRGSADYQLEKLKEGLLNGTSDDTTGQIAGVLTDFMVIGDVRDLVKQGVKLSNDEEVDEVLVALSTIGLAATAAQVASAGAATPIKGSVVALKVARKIGKLPSWLGKTILAAADTVKKTKKIVTIQVHLPTRPRPN